MECKNHKDRAGVNTCCVCGDWICEECSIEHNSRLYCRDCFLKKEKSEKEKEKVMFPDKRPSTFLTFCFAFIPGCGQMYLGLMKRGLVILSMFFAALYFASIFEVFTYTGIIMWFFSFFDVFNNKNKIDSGKGIDDSVNDIKAFFVENKPLIIVTLGAVMAMEILNHARLRLFNFDFDIKNLFFILIVIFIIFIISKKDKEQ